MEVVHLAAFSNPGKQSLIVVGGSGDIDADGVATAVELAFERLTAQRGPRPVAHVDVS